MITKHVMEKIVALVAGRTEMPVNIQSLDKLYFNDRLTGYSAQIRYWGADHRKDQQPPEPARWTTSIKPHGKTVWNIRLLWEVCPITIP
jgi:hypothetical protein